MTYNRARLFFAHLRDAMGDSAFTGFLRDYYSRWAFKHVDERAMRASVARAYGASLDWLFDEWVHGTGLLDYEIAAASTDSSAAGWTTRVDLRRRGALHFPMPVGVRVD